jgi:hypothetical protein
MKAYEGLNGIDARSCSTSFIPPGASAVIAIAK